MKTEGQEQRGKHDPAREHPFGVPIGGDFRCARCRTLLDGGTDEPVSTRELRAENERLHLMLKASEEHTQHHEAECDRLRAEIKRLRGDLRELAEAGPNALASPLCQCEHCGRYKQARDRALHEIEMSA